MLRYRRQEGSLSAKVVDDKVDGSVEFVLGNWSAITIKETVENSFVCIFVMELVLT